MGQTEASINNQTETPVKGNFIETPFPRIFYQLCRKNATGYLDIRDKPAEEGGKILKRVVFAEGQTFAVQGGNPNETLPEILVQKGKISAEQFEKLKGECGGDYGKMEQKVMGGAMVPFSELAELAGYQTSLKIKNLFALIGGVYEFKAQPLDKIYKKHALYPLSPEKLLFEGVTEHYLLPRIQKEFPGIEKKSFSLNQGWEQALAAMGAAPRARKELSGISSTFNWDAVVKSLPLPKDGAMAILFSLYLGEIAALADGDDDFPVGKAYLKAEESRLDQLKKEAEVKAKEQEAEEAKKKAAEKKPEEQKLPIEQMLEREMTDMELLAEIDKFLKTVNDAKKNYFEMFGVPEQAPQAKIKQVYFKFARRFHPDARPNLFVDKVRDKIEDLFARMTEIYEVLSDSDQRADYMKELRSHVSKEDMEKAKQAIEAEMEFQKAEILIKRGAFAEANELITRVIQLQPDEPEYQIYQAWAKYKLTGPGEGARAARTIKQLLEKRPKNADGFFFLGQIAKADGDIDQAENYFNQAAKFKPSDPDVKRELHLIHRRRLQPSSTSKKGGLFGKKK